eukprot:2295715-Ditylum_brightwellii.AAC.1
MVFFIGGKEFLNVFGLYEQHLYGGYEEAKETKHGAVLILSAAECFNGKFSKHIIDAEEESTQYGKEVSQHTTRILTRLGRLSVVILGGEIIISGGRVFMVRLFVIGKYVGEHPRKTGGSPDDVHKL